MVEAVSAEADRRSFWKFYESGGTLVFCDFVDAANRFNSVEDWIRVYTEPPAAMRMSLTPAIDPSLRTATVPWPPHTYREGLRWADELFGFLRAMLPGTVEFLSIHLQFILNFSVFRFITPSL